MVGSFGSAVALYVLIKVPGLVVMMSKKRFPSRFVYAILFSASMSLELANDNKWANAENKRKNEFFIKKFLGFLYLQR